MSGACAVGFAELVDYVFGDTTGEPAEALEEHLFECPRCAARLDLLDVMARSVSAAVREGALGGNVNAAFLAKARREGLTLRDYRIAEGTTVACSAGPEDLVVVRLAASFPEVEELRLDGTFHDLERDETAPLPARAVVVDRELGEVVLVFPGEVVRAYPRSRWTMRVHGEREELGPFVMDHTPSPTPGSNSFSEL